MAQSQAQQVLELTHPTAETTVLTAMRRGATEDAVHLADVLSSADFADPRNRVAFQAMVNVLRSAEPLDDTAILAECPQVARDMRLDVKIDGGWLAGLDGDPLRARAYAQTVKRLAYLRGGADFAFWFVGRLQERADPDQLFTEAQERIQALQPPSKTQRFVYGWDTVQAHRGEIAQRVKDAAAGKTNPFLWPWASWNYSVRPLRPGMLGLVAAADGVGKCLGKGTKVVKYDGTLCAVEDVKFGDLLMGPDSKPRIVRSVTRGSAMMYWVRQAGAMDYRVNGDHILALYERKAVHEGHYRVGWRKQYVEVSVKDALQKWKPGHMRRHLQGFKVAVDWTERNVPMPPYMLGLWLGDGSQNSIQFSITNADTEVTQAFTEYAESLQFNARGRDFQGTVTTQTKPGNAASTYSISLGVKGAHSAAYKENSPICILRDLGVTDEKHIPRLYLANSEQVRLELLAGLIDSDGYYYRNGNAFEIASINRRLIGDIKFLADSLGFKTSLAFKVAKSQNGTEVPAWRLIISGDVERIPTRIERKQARGRLINKDWRMTAIRIEQDKVDDYYGFQLGGDGLFLLEDMTVTHNSTYLEMIAEHWALGGMHVVYVHLEDALDYKLDRRLARWARVPLQALEDGTTTTEQQQATEAAQGKIDRSLTTLHYFDAAGMSAGEIVTELKARVQEGVCQAVVLDYLDKMQPSRAQAKLYGDQIWERQSNDVELLKTFAERHSLPIMTASQGNKGMQQQTGTRTRRDIQGSGAKTQKAQMVAILTREMVGDDGLRDSKGVVLAEPGEYSPFIDVRIDKQNRGRTGVTMRQFLIGQFFDIRDVDIQRTKLDY